jgi:integrase
MLVPRKPGTTKRLTKASVDALTAHDGTADLFDTEIRGFHVRAWPAFTDGKVRKVFRLKYFMHGRQRVITLGEYGPKTTEEARKIALKMRALVTDGVDPLDHREAERERAIRIRAESETIKEVFERWMRDGPASKISKRASSWATNERHFRNHILPLLGHVEVRKLTVQQVEKAQLDIAKGRTAKNQKTKNRRGRSRVRGGMHIARNAILSLSAMLTWYRRDHATYQNPVVHVDKVKPTKRKTKLTQEQAHALLKKLDEVVEKGVITPVWADAIRMLLFTPGRKSEILRLAWSEVHTNRCCIELPEARDKNGNAKDVPLNAFARALLERRRIEAADAGQRSKWVFPSSRNEGPIVGLQKVWEDIRSECGLHGVWLHDLRRTWATFAAEAGGAPATIALALSHTQIQTQSHYVHVEWERALRLADAVGETLQQGSADDEPHRDRDTSGQAGDHHTGEGRSNLAGQRKGIS